MPSSTFSAVLHGLVAPAQAYRKALQLEPDDAETRARLEAMAGKASAGVAADFAGTRPSPAD